MKPLILCSLALLLSQLIFAQAQPYQPFDFEKGRWGSVSEVVFFDVFNNPSYARTYFNHYCQGDTVLAGERFQLLYEDTTLVGALREDNNRQIWYHNFPNSSPPRPLPCPHYTLPADTTILLYDFSLTTGDSLPYLSYSYCSDNAPQHGYIHVIGEDSLAMLDGSYRRLLMVDFQFVDSSQGSFHSYGYWVEGIGTISETGYGNLSSSGAWGPSSSYYNSLNHQPMLQGGLLGSLNNHAPTIFGLNGSQYTTCYQEDSLYLLGLRGQTRCSYANSVARLAVPSTLQVAPNPFSQHTALTLDQPYESLRLDLYDSMGRLIVQQHGSGNQLTVHRGALPAGLYVYRVYAAEELLGVGKVVVE